MVTQRETRTLPLLGLAAVGFVLGCPSQSSPVADSGADGAELDAGPDGSRDAGSDGGLDASSDASFDAWSGDAAGDADVPVEPLGLTFEEPAIDLEGIDARFASDVAYGPHEDNRLDIFLVEASEPTPLVIFIHGGGFVGGDKSSIYSSGASEIRGFLSAGVSFATINYRLLVAPETEGVLKSLGDSRRCLQFLRHHHEELNVDPERVAVYGGSAGAGTSLWLAFNDDMADPDAADPVLRESTRLRAAGARATQASYDVMTWQTVVFASLGMTLRDMFDLPDTSLESLLAFYGVATLEELTSPEIAAYRETVDMLGLMSADDPPFWVRNTVANVGVPADRSELYHHVLHAVALVERADEVGVEHVAYIPPLGVADPSGDDVVQFLVDRLTTE